MAESLAGECTGIVLTDTIHALAQSEQYFFSSILCIHWQFWINWNVWNDWLDWSIPTVPSLPRRHYPIFKSWNAIYRLNRERSMGIAMLWKERNFHSTKHSRKAIFRRILVIKHVMSGRHHKCQGTTLVVIEHIQINLDLQTDKWNDPYDYALLYHACSMIALHWKLPS